MGTPVAQMACELLNNQVEPDQRRAKVVHGVVEIVRLCQLAGACFFYFQRKMIVAPGLSWNDQSSVLSKPLSAFIIYPIGLFIMFAFCCSQAVVMVIMVI